MYCSNFVDKVLYNRFDEGIQPETLGLRFLHPSVTDPVESLSSLGFWKKRHWVGQFPTGSAYFPVGFFHTLI